MSAPHYILQNGNYGRGSQPEIVAAEGAWLIDAGGKRLLDMGLGAGSQILGHAHPSVVNAIQKQASSGNLYLYNNPQIHTLCGLLQEMLPQAQRHYVFCNSGSESTQRALRLARAATGRDRIACFQGGWHGMNEWTLVDDGSRLGIPAGVLPSGIPTQMRESSVQLPYNVDEAFDLIRNHAASLAAVIIEPVQGSNPRDDVIPFLRRLSEVCQQYGILVIYDEIITGFRLGVSGASGRWGLNPDIVTYGKILAGGLPVGLMTCTDEVAARTFGNKEKTILTGGTFSANPLVAVAAAAVMRELQRADYEKLDALGAQFRNTLNEAFQWSRLPFAAIGTGSFNRVVFTNLPFRNRSERDALELNGAYQKRFRQNLLQQDLLWPANGIVFTGFCHDEVLIIDACQKVILSAIDCLNVPGTETQQMTRNRVLADRLLAREYGQHASRIGGTLTRPGEIPRNSDRIFVLGSGASIADVSDAQWQQLGQFDTLAINYFYFHRFRPRMHFIELGKSVEARQAVHDLLLNDPKRREEYVFMQIRHLHRNNVQLHCSPGRARLYSPMIFKTRDVPLLEELLRTHYLSSASDEPLVHHASTLDCGIHFAVRQGYREICLLGVDLNSNQYFWDLEDGNQNYRRAQEAVNADYEAAKWTRDPNAIHATANTTITDRLGCLDVCSYLQLVDKTVLKPAGISLTICNPNSRLVDFICSRDLNDALEREPR